MKNFKLSLAFLAVFSMFFISCDKEEVSNPDVSSEKATLSFGAIVNDLVTNRASTKQSVSDLPECSDDTPAYVSIVLSQGGMDVVGNDDEPFHINLVDGQVFTEEVSELELEPGDYSLEYFTVHNSDGDVIWVAPMTDSPLGEYVDMSLPMDIDLRAGVKKYVDVSVLCYDDREVNEYGYVFFDIDTNMAIKFCIFGNYCPPSGRHYPASYSVSVWSGTSTTGTPLYTDVYNETDYYDNGDYYAEPLCFALPDTEGLDEYYFQITLRSSDEYGDVEETIIRAGVINDDEVRNFFDGDNNLDYYHFREGCDGDDTPPVFPDPNNDTEYYKTCAYPLNESGAIALAYFQLEGNLLKTTVLASGMEPNKMHPQHIHGLEDGTNATCPPESADTDGDGYISIEEGLPFYGGVLLSLNYENGDFPIADSWGNYIYQRNFTVNSTTMPNPENLVVVAHGMNVEGSYWASLPVACGEITELE